MTDKLNPSPEVKERLKRFCEVNRKKYGENWKEILAAEMSAKMTAELKRAGILK